jgi:hypothetical protein
MGTFKIFALLNIVFSGLMFITTKMGPLILLALIILISGINLMMILFQIFIDNMNIDDDTIIQDTLKYKMLEYVDYVQDLLTDQNKTEPLFQIFTVKTIISIIIYLYFGAIFTVLLMIFLILLITLLPLFKENINIDTENLSEEKFKSHFTSDIFFGIIVGIVLQIIHKIFYSSLIHNKLLVIRQGYSNLDFYILSTLNSQFQLIKEDIIAAATDATNEGKEIAAEKGKKTFLLKLYDIHKGYDKNNRTKIMQKIIEASKIGENVDSNRMKAGCMLFVLYSHLYDNIPDTNLSAQKKIQKYFFNVCKTETTDDYEICSVDANDKGSLPYASFFLAKDGVSFIKKDLYKDLVDDATTEYLDDIVENVNLKLREIPEFGNLYSEMIAFSSILFGVSVAFGILYYKVVRHFSSTDDKKKINMVTSFLQEKMKSIPKPFTKTSSPRSVKI